MSFVDFLLSYIFYYPLLMSTVWVVASLFHFFRRERGNPQTLPKELTPLVSVVIPAHNEEKVISDTLEAALKLDYPSYEVIVVDDGSTDHTPQIIANYTQRKNFRIVLKEVNEGKALALNDGALLAKGEIILTLDADALPDSKILQEIVPHFISSSRVGAVTGNPLVRNRTTLLAKIQTAEFTSIISLIKRAQRILGKLLTVSGVVAAFRKAALIDVGFWDPDIVTEDINLTWKLQKRAWDVRFEAKAVAWILVPESLRGFWHQRVRWTQGGIEVMRRHADVWRSWRQRRILGVYIEYILSIIWAYDFIIMAFLWLVSITFGIKIPSASPIPQWWGALLSVMCLAQFATAVLLNRRYDPTLSHYYFWVVWYPLVYWILNALAVVWATPKGLTRPLRQPATWSSPDRGIHLKN